MSETTIGDEIWANNTTLFRELDTLDVPTINDRVTALAEQVMTLSEQLVQLGQIVDTNQGINTERWLTLQTDLSAFEISTTSSILALNQSLASMMTTVNELNTQVQVVTGNVNALQSEFLVLQLSFNALQTLVNSYNSRITAIENTFASIPLNYVNLYYSNAYVVPNITHIITFMNEPGTTFGFSYEIRFSVVSGTTSLTLRKRLLATLTQAGSPYLLGISLQYPQDNNINPIETNSDWMIPVGTRLRMNIVSSNPAGYVGIGSCYIIKKRLFP